MDAPEPPRDNKTGARASRCAYELFIDHKTTKTDYLQVKAALSASFNVPPESGSSFVVTNEMSAGVYSLEAKGTGGSVATAPLWVVAK